MVASPASRWPLNDRGLDGTAPPRGFERLAVRLGGRLPLILHENLVVIVDEGHAVASDYHGAAALARERAAYHPNGLGCVVLIPSRARPPAESARRGIKEAIHGTTAYVRCLCWMVEGSGFRAATLRAALAGLNLFIATKLPTSVEKDLASSLRWSLDRLSPNGAASTGRLIAVVGSVEQALQSFHT